MSERRAARALVALAALVTVTVGVSACGVPTGDETFSPIQPGEDPFGLDETTTTTTTTTTTIPIAPESTVAPPTTIPIRLDPVELYFLSRGRLQPVVRDLPPGFSANQVADILQEGPPPDLALETLIEDGLIVKSIESRGVLTVDLDAGTFARIPSTQQTEAIGQIVMTMVRSLRGIGFVTFTIDDEPISVKKGNSLLSEVGEPLVYDDYVVLLVNPPAPADTTTTIAAVPTGSLAGQ